MATTSRPKKANSCVESLPEYQKLKSDRYIPFNLEEEAPAENEFFTDKGTDVGGPALFSTRGTRYEKRSSPKVVDTTLTEIKTIADEYSSTVKIIAARFRKDFPLDCKAVDETSWKHLSYYFDDLDIYHWGSNLLQQVLSCIAEENSTLHNRILRFAVHLLATDNSRARQLAYFGKGIWFYEEIDHYGEEFLEETVKFMTHRSDVIQKLTPCAVKYLQEAKGDSYMQPMWYDDSFKKLTEARTRALRTAGPKSGISKHDMVIPLASTLDSTAEKPRTGGHHRRTSSFEEYKGFIKSNEDYKSDTVVENPKVNDEIKHDSEGNITQTGIIVRKKNNRVLARHPGNQRQFSGEDGVFNRDQRKPNAGNLNERRAIAESQRSSSDSNKFPKIKKKGNNNKHRESGLREEFRTSSSPAKIHDTQFDHARKPSGPRSIFDEDDSIVSIKINGEKRNSPNQSPQIPMANFSIQPSRGSEDSYRTISNPNMNGTRRSGQSQFSKIMHPYGQPSFPGSGQPPPWHQPLLSQPPNQNVTPYMMMPNVEVAPAPNQYVQWGTMPPMPPVQTYSQGANSSFYGVMQQDQGPPYHSHYDPMPAPYYHNNQTFQPYQSENRYGRKEQYKSFPNDIRSAHRRWNFHARGQRREYSREVSSEYFEPGTGVANNFSPTYGPITHHDTNVNPYSAMAPTTADICHHQTCDVHKESANAPDMEISNNMPTTESPPFRATEFQTESTTVQTVPQDDEKQVETGTISAPGFQYPMTYPRVGSTGHMENTTTEVVPASDEQVFENVESATVLHKDSTEVQSPNFALVETQNLDSHSLATNGQDDKKSGRTERKPKEYESGLGNSQTAKGSIPEATGRYWSNSSLSPRNQHHQPTDPLKLYVSGLHLTDQAVTRIFESYRPSCITATRPCRRFDLNGHTTKEGMRYAFISFDSVEDCDATREALCGTTQDGIKLRVYRAFVPRTESTAEGLTDILENPNLRLPEKSGQINRAKARRVASPIQMTQVTETQKQGNTSANNKNPENDGSITVEPVVTSLSAPDHPPILGRLKKSKNTSKPKTKRQVRSSVIHVIDGTVTTSAPSSSLGDQNQPRPTSTENQFKSKTFRDIINERSMSSRLLTPKDNNKVDEKDPLPVENELGPSDQKDGIIQPPNSPIDTVMTDVPEINLPTLQQICLDGNTTDNDSEQSYQSAPESSRVDNEEPADLDTLLGNAEGIERVLNKYRPNDAEKKIPNNSHTSSMSVNIRSGPPTTSEIQREDSDKLGHGIKDPIAVVNKDNESQDDDATKGWDISVKVNTKNSQKKRRKAKAKSISILHEANDISTKHDQDTTDAGHSPDSVKSKKSA